MKKRDLVVQVPECNIDHGCGVVEVVEVPIQLGVWESSDSRGKTHRSLTPPGSATWNSSLQSIVKGVLARRDSKNGAQAAESTSDDSGDWSLEALHFWC
mmetsp:Transcript_3003/g.5306  ORF Transcript_3003/g.5306 Transcript_3003/m.5306 type:complete len:99 (+) Transcript_3003:294-590(+)